MGIVYPDLTIRLLFKFLLLESTGRYTSRVTIPVLLSTSSTAAPPPPPPRLPTTLPYLSHATAPRTTKMVLSLISSSASTTGRTDGRTQRNVVLWILTNSIYVLKDNIRSVSEIEKEEVPTNSKSLTIIIIMKSSNSAGASHWGTKTEEEEEPRRNWNLNQLFGGSSFCCLNQESHDFIAQELSRKDFSSSRHTNPPASHSAKSSLQFTSSGAFFYIIRYNKSSNLMPLSHTAGFRLLPPDFAP